jgi:hypothetical protein
VRGSPAAMRVPMIWMVVLTEWTMTPMAKIAAWMVPVYQQARVKRIPTGSKSKGARCDQYRNISQTSARDFRLRCLSILEGVSLAHNPYICRLGLR